MLRYVSGGLVYCYYIINKQDSPKRETPGFRNRDRRQDLSAIMGGKVKIQRNSQDGKPTAPEDKNRTCRWIKRSVSREICYIQVNSQKRVF